MNAVLYIHGKDVSASESKHYKPLFPECEVIGMDYQTFSPWETGREIHNSVEEMKTKYGSLILIANSIGAYFSMSANAQCHPNRYGWWRALVSHRGVDAVFG